jgi:RNA-binding protein YlmH
MSDETELLKKRFSELAAKSYNADIFTFTDFLGLAEQSVFETVKRQLGGVKYTAFGGADGAERVMLRFGDEGDLGYEVPFPITALKISPKDKKFAEKLTHRDFLGALLNLGIERSCLGDIIIIDNSGYLFCKDSIAEYIVSELFRVRRTEVTVSLVDTLPEGELYKTEELTVQISSERLDAVIARVFSLSREDAQNLFSKRLVFASGREIESTSYSPKEGEKISVRGYGRFIYRGFKTLSKKGKLNAIVEIYI